MSENEHRKLLIVCAVMVALLMGMLGFVSNMAFDNPPDGTETITHTFECEES